MHYLGNCPNQGRIRVACLQLPNCGGNLRAQLRRRLRNPKIAKQNSPGSEYLVKAVGEGRLGSINVAVDVCNIVSLHSGLPISVVDLACAREPFRVSVAPPGASYVFNASGQSIELGGLLCLFDAEGPCANAVKDAQRTKTGPETRSTVSLIWGSVDLPGRAAQAETGYRA